MEKFPVIIFPDGYKMDYQKREVQSFLEELLHASYLFIGSKDMDTFTLIVTQILTEGFRARFAIDRWCDLTVRDTKFHDLAMLAKAWLEVQERAMKDHVAHETGVFSEEQHMNFHLGAGDMQWIANHTGKIMNKNYDGAEDIIFITKKVLKESKNTKNILR